MAEVLRVGCTIEPSIQLLGVLCVCTLVLSSWTSRMYVQWSTSDKPTVTELAEIEHLQQQLVI